LRREKIGADEMLVGKRFEEVPSCTEARRREEEGLQAGWLLKGKELESWAFLFHHRRPSSPSPPPSSFNPPAWENFLLLKSRRSMHSFLESFSSTDPTLLSTAR